MQPIVFSARTIPFVLLIAFLSLVAWMRPAAAVPEIQSWTTDKGLRVYFVQTEQLPMVDMRVVFDAGSARDGEHPGLSRLTNALLNKGAGDWNADEIAAKFDSVGADYGAGSLRDMAYVSLRSLTDPHWFDPALDTFVTVLTEPTFPKRDLDRARKQTFVALRDQAQDPGQIASEAYYRAVYGDHPYAHPDIGTEESVKAIRRGDLKDHYGRYYVARNAVLAVVGDLSREQVNRIAERIAAGLGEGEAAAPLPPVPELKGAKTIHIPYPSEQAHIYMGQPGMRRGDPDYFALYLGNHVLGGSGFTSRLMKEIRVDRGLAYSVYSYFLPMARKGPFLMGLQTRVDQADEAVGIVRDTLAGFIEKGPSREELQASKANITGGFPLRTASNGDIVEYLAMIGFYRLPLDYLSTFVSKVDAVDVETIRETFSRRVDPDKLVTVVVGGESADR